MSVTSGQATITDAVKQLKSAWDRTRDSWDDPVADRIEQEFLADIEPRARQALAAMAKMQQIIARMRQECGE